ARPRGRGLRPRRRRGRQPARRSSSRWRRRWWDPGAGRPPRAAARRAGAAIGPRARRPRRWCRSRRGRGSGGEGSCGRDPGEEPLGQLGLAERPHHLALAAGAEEDDAVGAGPEAGALLVGVVEDDPVEVLAAELVEGVGLAVVGFEGEADEGLAVALLFAEGGEDVGGAAEMEDEGVVAGLLLLLLALGGRGGGEVGHGGGGEDEVGVGVLHR